MKTLIGRLTEEKKAYKRNGNTGGLAVWIKAMDCMVSNNETINLEVFESQNWTSDEISTLIELTLTEEEKRDLNNDVLSEVFGWHIS